MVKMKKAKSLQLNLTLLTERFQYVDFNEDIHWFILGYTSVSKASFPLNFC